MAFDELKERAGEAERELRNYGEAAVEYYKLRAFRMVMKGLLFITKNLILAVLLMLILLFISVGAALAIGAALESPATGFFIVSGIYLLVFILAYFLRDTLNGPLLGKFSEFFYDDE